MKAYSLSLLLTSHTLPLCFLLRISVTISLSSLSPSPSSLSLLPSSFDFSRKFVMDLWCAHIKNPNLSPLLLRNSFSERPFSCYLAKVGSFRPEDGRLFEIRVASRKASSLVVRAMGKKNHDNSSSSGNFFFLRLHGFWISSL